MKSSTQDKLVFAGIIAGVLLVTFLFKLQMFVSTQPVLTITSSGFVDGGEISKTYTCDGQGQSPALTISGVPTSAQTLVLAMQDLDIPRTEFVHWLVYGIAPNGVFSDNALPVGSEQGLNAKNERSYIPVCPPEGKTHHYQLSVYAVNKGLHFVTPPNLQQLKTAIRGSVVAKGVVTARYTRKAVAQ